MPFALSNRYTPPMREATTQPPKVKGISLRWRAIALFVAVGVAPAAVVGVLLTGVNTRAVVIAERQRQAAVASELSGQSLRHVVDVMDDTRALATAISLAAGSSDPADAMAGVRSLLASRRGIDAVRFEVPSARVDTVIQTEHRRRPVPASTPALRALANERGVAFLVQPDGSGIVVAGVEPARDGGAQGYVSAEVELAVLDTVLADLAGSHFDDPRVSLMVVDSTRHVVAQHNAGRLSRGADASGLPIWGMLPEGASWAERVAIVGNVSIDGEASVANVVTVPSLGWAVAIWRPQAVAYGVLSEMRRNMLIASVAALVLAVVAGWFAGRSVTRPVLHIAEQAQRIGRRRWDEVRVRVDRGDELGQLASSIQQMADDLRAGEQEIAREAKLRGDLSRFLSKELVDAILEGRHPLSLGGHRAEVSVLFADVVAFTPLAESRPAEEVVKLLNELFSMLSEIVFRHHGMVDKFIGDCIMAVWGAAEAQPDHAVRAVAAADDMMRFLETAAAGWRETYGVEIRLGIGINSGQALVGNVGSSKRMEFTVIGDVVNVASRLETIARPNQVLLTEATRSGLGDTFDVVALGGHDITGRKGRTEVFALAQDI